MTSNLVAQTAAPEASPSPAEKCDKCGPRPPHDPLEKLNLTADQKSQVQTIMQKTRADIKTIRENPALSPEQKDQQIQAIKQATDEQMKSILTPEQHQKFEEMKAARKNKGEENGGKWGKEGRNGPHNPFEQLNLSEEQKTQIHPIMQKTGDEIKAIKENASLAPAQKEEQIQAIRQNTDEMLKTILTPEQYQKLEAMKAEHKARMQHHGENSDAPAPAPADN